MNQDLEFTHTFLRHVHPEEEGWIMSRNKKLDTVKVDCSFQNEFSLTLIILHTQDPFVSKQHLSQAIEIQTAYAKENLGLKVKVLLVYGHLLMKPHNVPKNIAVVSVMEEEDESYNYCSN